MRLELYLITLYVLYSSYTVHANGSLSVTKLDLEHAGMYQCFLRNAAGETSKSTWLTVNSSPPEFLTRPSNVTIVAGGDARFPCDTRGAPKPLVTWTKSMYYNNVQDVLIQMFLLLLLFIKKIKHSPMLRLGL